MMRKVSISKAKKGTLKRLFKMVFKENKLSMVVVIMLMVTATFANIFAIYNVQNVIREAIDMVETNSTNFSGVIRLIITMIALYLINIAATYTYLRIMVDVSQNTLVKLRKNLFTHMTSLPIQYFDTHQHGELMSRFTNDVDATRQMISQSMPQLIVSILTVIGYMAAMLFTSLTLGLVGFVVVICLVIYTQRFNFKTKDFFIRQQKALGKMNGYIEEMIEGQKVVKVFRYEKQAIKKFKVINEDLYNHSVKAAFRSGILIPITVNIGYLLYAIVALTGAFLYQQSLLKIPAIVVFLLYTRNITGPLNQISQQANFIGMAVAGSSRIFEVLDETPEENNGQVELVYATYENDTLVQSSVPTNTWAWKHEDQNLTQLKGDVRFNDVDFGYVEGQKVLKDVSLFAKPGQKIAFVGATGAGKTTITNLINRFYEIQSGTITYDGIPIKHINKNSLRNSLGMVLQDTSLFTNTVMENIRYGKLDATDEEVVQAAILANADEFIKKLPQGYQTILQDNGSNLSQGQRQLIAIARAAINNPPVLILDEATSSIDTYTEKLIQSGMDKLMQDRTVFVIAHRLSTIKNAKAIMVLDQGKIIERGNHDDLMEQKGRYYQLYLGLFELE